jgi:peptide/nickel transport system permease protein
VRGICIGVLAAVHLLALFAEWVAPYGPGEQHREHAWAAPALFFHRGEAGAHLERVKEPGKIFLLGTDGLGRDQFSRLVYGARVSLLFGLGAAGVAALLGLLVGGAAGYFGGWVDRVAMRVAELFLALPWMYLLLAARAFFPLETDDRLVAGAMMLLLGAVGWARPGRLVRGIVMTAKEREYVLAAKGFGAGPWYLLRRHVLPEAYPAVVTYAGLAIPQYILAEATLQFLGLGVSGSAPSWGTLIAGLAQLEVVGGYWWMWIPAGVLVVVCGCYNWLSRERVERCG